MAMQSKRIVIVGAGFSGLTTAFELQERLPDAEITILETQRRPGGMLWTERADKYLFEYGPLSFPTHRLSLMKLCKRLGLVDQLVKTGPAFSKRLLLHTDGVIHTVPGGMGSALTSPLFGMASAFRLITERLRPSGAGKNKMDESVYQFAERRLGQELAQIIADAATTDVFASDARAISIRSGFSQYARAEKEFGNVLGGIPRLRRAERDAAQKAGVTLDVQARDGYSFQDGMKTLIVTLQNRLKCQVKLGVGAQTIQQAPEGAPGRWLVRCSDGVTIHADTVVLACQAYRQAAILADLDTELADSILSIPHAGIINIALGYKRMHVPSVVDSHSILVPQRFKRDLIRIAFPSGYLPDRAPEDHVLFQITLGGWSRKEMLAWEDDALILSTRRELRSLLKISKPPQFFRLVRWPKSIPQYTLGHSQRVTRIEEQLKAHAGLFLGGNAYYGVTLHESATHAERIARKVRDYLKSSK